MYKVLKTCLLSAPPLLYRSSAPFLQGVVSDSLQLGTHNPWECNFWVIQFSIPSTFFKLFYVFQSLSRCL